MLWIALIFLTLAAVLHVYIWVLEQFLWDKPQGLKTFRLDPEFATNTKEMAANQGLYNLMLAVVTLIGVIGVWAEHEWGYALAYAGAGSMVVAGAYLALTSADKRKAALIQLTPGLIGVLTLLASSAMG